LLAEEDITNSCLKEKREAITAAMRRRGKLLVAFSGGVDSGLVAKLAFDALGKDAIAVVADAETLPRRELEAAFRMAGEIGIELQVMKISELENKDYVQNTWNRCYFCRQGLGEKLRIFAEERGIETIADGVNFSDLTDHRPGISAMDEYGFWHPFVEYRVSKMEVRQLAKVLALSFYDKPSSPCLSSRIVYGEVITLEKLKQVEEAEDFLRSLGFRELRVRHHDRIARIEVPKAEIPRLLDPSISSEVVKELKRLGFTFVAVDLEGFRSGSLNDVLQNK